MLFTSSLVYQVNYDCKFNCVTYVNYDYENEEMNVQRCYASNEYAVKKKTTAWVIQKLETGLRMRRFFQNF